MEPNRAQLLVDRMEINANSKEKRMIAMLDLKWDNKISGNRDAI